MVEFKVGQRVVIENPQSTLERVSTGTVVPTPFGWDGVAVQWDGSVATCGAFAPEFLKVAE